MTLSRFMIESTRSNPDHADLESLMSSIQIACKAIATNVVSKAGIVTLDGQEHYASSSSSSRSSSSSSSSSSGDGSLSHADAGQAIFDRANSVLKSALRFTGKLGVLSGSTAGDNNSKSNNNHPMLIEEAWNSKYVAVFDPLDGSDNIDAGISTGTIFGIFTEAEECLVDFGEDVSDSARQCLLQTLQPGVNLVAAGYCLYSSSTVLMLSFGAGVHGFTLDPSIGEFILTHPNVKIPSRGRYYSVNEANQHKWSNNLQDYFQDIKRGRGELGASYTARYIGSLVADIHRTLLYGGIFAYPADSKRPKGKLNLLHEVGPLAFLVEQAGGGASTGYGRILEIVPKALDEKTGCFLGSKDDVKEVEKYLAR